MTHPSHAHFLLFCEEGLPSRMFLSRGWLTNFLDSDGIVLYCIVLYCIVLYCIVLYCIVLYYISLYFILQNCFLLHRIESIVKCCSTVDKHKLILRIFMNYIDVMRLKKI